MDKRRSRRAGLALTLGLAMTMVPLLANAGPGDLDTTFGNGGQVITNVGVDDVLTSLTARYDDSSIRAGGYTTCFGTCSVTAATPHWLLTGYTPSGALDPTFSNDGILREDELIGEIHSVRTMPSADTMAAGWTTLEGSRVATAASYKPDGRRGTVFRLDARGRTGALITSTANSVDRLYYGGENTSIIAGAIGDGNNRDFLVARISDETGSLHAGFADNGILRVDIQGSYDEATAAAVDPYFVFYNKVVVGGFSWNGHDHDFALIKVDDEGTLDTSFGGDGKVVTGVNRLGGDDGISAVSVLPDGKVLAAGNSCYPDSTTCYFALVRYNWDGTVDSSFGTGRAGFEDGGATVNGFGYNDHATAMAVGPNGDIYLAGYTAVNGDLDRMVARYLPDGTPDPSFGTNGILVDAAPGNDALTSILLQGDNKVIVGGSITQNSAQDFALTRYLGDYSGTPDPTTSPSASPSSSPSPSASPTGPPERVESSISLDIDKSAEKIKASGEVDPFHENLTVTVVLLKRVNGDFVKVNDKDVLLDDFSTYVAKFNRPNNDRCRIKVRFAGDTDHLPSSIHKTFDC